MTTKFCKKSGFCNEPKIANISHCALIRTKYDDDLKAGCRLPQATDRPKGNECLAKYLLAIYRHKSRILSSDLLANLGQPLGNEVLGIVKDRTNISSDEQNWQWAARWCWRARAGQIQTFGQCGSSLFIMAMASTSFSSRVLCLHCIHCLQWMCPLCIAHNACVSIVSMSSTSITHPTCPALVYL